MVFGETPLSSFLKRVFCLAGRRLGRSSHEESASTRRARAASGGQRRRHPLVQLSPIVFYLSVTASRFCLLEWVRTLACVLVYTLPQPPPHPFPSMYPCAGFGRVRFYRYTHLLSAPHGGEGESLRASHSPRALVPERSRLARTVAGRSHGEGHSSPTSRRASPLFENCRILRNNPEGGGLSSAWRGDGRGRLDHRLPAASRAQLSARRYGIKTHHRHCLSSSLPPAPSCPP